LNRRNVFFWSRGRVRKKERIGTLKLHDGTWMMLVNTLQNTLPFWLFGESSTRNSCIRNLIEDTPLCFQTQWQVRWSQSTTYIFLLQKVTCFGLNSP
jgi:hypothetical protein